MRLISAMFARWFNSSRSRLGLAWLAGLVVAAALIAGAGYASLGSWPAVGARGAAVLRRLLGPVVVAKLENTVFQIQDELEQLKYHANAARPAAPWEAATAEPGRAPAATLSPGAAPTPAPSGSTAPADGRQWPSWPNIFGTPSAWPPDPLPANGSIPGEGRWTPYLYNPSGQVVAYRTFTQPDPQRPYTVVAIVAFDLHASSLHFVLGSQEPASSVPIDRPGTIPPADFQAGSLLAAFNGGFKAEHGHFGVVVDGVTLLPPRPGFGTVAIYPNGQVRIGAWGTGLTASPPAVAYRQNGPLLIQDGQVNPRIADNSPQDWGYTVGGRTATWRSGLGISADGRTLYYVAGPSLTLPALAQALVGAGAAQAVQLDINDYWVHFDAFKAGQGGLQTAPLFDSMKVQYDQRYLRGFTRDYFYVTANAG